MTVLAAGEGSRPVQVIIGVDTHQDQHVAVAINEQGVRLGEYRVMTTSQGYAELQQWSRSLGEICVFGIKARAPMVLVSPGSSPARATPSLRSIDPTVQHAAVKGRATPLTRRWLLAPYFLG